MSVISTKDSRPQPAGDPRRGADARTRRTGQAVTTIDHDLIREWAEARNGFPVSVPGTAKGGGSDEIRIDIPGPVQTFTTFQQIPWDDWFARFEEKGLTFVYQESAGPQTSKFYELVARPGAEERAALHVSSAHDVETQEAQRRQMESLKSRE